MKIITSRDNALFKQLVKLTQSSHERRKLGQTVLDGVHLIEGYAHSVGAPVLVVVSESGEQKAEVQALLRALPGVPQHRFTDAMFNDVAAVQTPIGVLALIDTPSPPPLPAQLGTCIALEDIQDPGNLGAILRTAAAAGVSHVLLSKGCTFAWAPRVIRAGMGAHFALAIHEHVDLVAALHGYRGRALATLARAPKSLYDVDLRGDTAFLIGNEGAGLSQALLALAHERVTIPMPGKIESLNAAAAAAICLFERVRQLGAPLRSGDA